MALSAPLNINIDLLGAKEGTPPLSDSRSGKNESPDGGMKISKNKNYSIFFLILSNF
jgi:hypothetical protein